MMNGDTNYTFMVIHMQVSKDFIVLLIPNLHLSQVHESIVKEIDFEGNFEQTKQGVVVSINMGCELG